MLMDIGDLHKACEVGCEHRRGQDETLSMETFVDFLPPAKTFLDICPLRATSLPVGLQCCYGSQFKFADDRRTNLVACDGVRVVGVYVKPTMITGRIVAVLD